MSADRSCVLAVILDIREELLVGLTAGVVRPADMRTAEIVQRACVANGITVDLWVAALRGDPELVQIFEKALDEIVLEPPDPGPYDEISRESPGGTPEPLPQAFERDARLLGRRAE